MIPGIVAQTGNSGPIIPPERWWRVRFPSLNTGNAQGSGSENYCDIRQIEMATSVGDVNLLPTATARKANPRTSVAMMLNAEKNIDMWNNQGIQVIGDGMWGAWLLPTGLPINEVRIRAYGSYTPHGVIVESSLDGLDWKFEFGYSRTSWNNTLQSFPRLDIDWKTHQARDWLIDVYKTSGWQNLGIFEMEMASVKGGPDLCVGGIPRSTGNSTYPASNLTDNNTASLCGSYGLAKRSYVGYTFSEPVNVEEMRLLCLPSEQPDWFNLAVSLGTPGSFFGPWYIKSNVQGLIADGWVTVDTRNAINKIDDRAAHRYWRIRPTRGTQANELTLFAVGELDFRVNGVSLVGSGTAIASSNYDTNAVPSKAFDGDTATRWLCQGPYAGYQWLGYDFGTPVKPDEIIMKSNPEEQFWGRTPTDFDVDWSDDGEMWYPKVGLGHDWTGPSETYSWPLTS
jgi:hypothetical protein